MSVRNVIKYEYFIRNEQMMCSKQIQIQIRMRVHCSFLRKLDLKVHLVETRDVHQARDPMGYSNKSMRGGGFYFPTGVRE